MRELRKSLTVLAGELGGGFRSGDDSTAGLGGSTLLSLLVLAKIPEKSKMNSESSCGKVYQTLTSRQPHAPCGARHGGRPSSSEAQKH